MRKNYHLLHLTIVILMGHQALKAIEHTIGDIQKYGSIRDQSYERRSTRSPEDPSCSVTVITAAQIPYTILTPGHYVLGENTNYSPLLSVPAITIDSDDVVLDLCNNTLTQTNDLPDVVGIQVNPNHSSITIENGNESIRDFTSAGILVTEGNTVISLRDITVIGCGRITPLGSLIFDSSTPVPYSAGIAFRGTDTSHITNVTINSINSLLNEAPSSITAQTITGGLVAVFADNVLIENSSFNQNGRQGISPSLGGGVIIAASSSVKITNCMADSNFGTFAAAGMITIASDTLVFSRELEFIRNMYNNNLSVSGMCAGIALLQAQNFSLRECTSHGNLFSGFVLVGSQSGIIQDCIATGGQNIGFLIQSSSSNVFKQCFCLGNNSTNPGDTAGGFLDGDGQNNVYEDCVAVNNGNTSPTFTGGFLIANGTSISITDSTTKFNQGPGIFVANSQQGFFNNNNVIANLQGGIIDNDAGSLTNSNAYSSNYAERNGGAGNYALPAGAPVRLWVLGTPPSPVDNNGILDPQLDNMSLT
jgi:hypothetical protein